MPGIGISTNVLSLRSQRRLSEASEHLSETFKRLSSGQRINSASDDAAGLAISSGLSMSSRVYTQGIRNLNDAMSVLSISEGAFKEISGIVTRLKELAEQSANGVYTSAQRQALDQEAQALISENNRIVATTSFNGVKLLDGTFQGVSIQAGFGSNERLQLSVGTISLSSSSSSTSASGDGTFGALITVAAGASYSLVTGDFNGDGKADIAVESGGAVIFMSNGNGTFKAGVNYSGGLTGMISGDVNGDGNIDLLGQDNGNFKLNVLIGNGNGTFKFPVSSASATSLSGTNFLSSGDFNGDGKLDVVTAEDYSMPGWGEILLGNGNGFFSAPSAVFGGGDYGCNIVSGDVNGDGKLDVIVDDGYNDTYAGIYAGTGSGTFNFLGSATLNLNNDRTPGLKLKDVNNDGKLDLIGSDNMGNKVSVLLGNGDGTFKAGRSFSTGTSPGKFDIADTNGDGNYDILVSDTTAGTVSLLLGNGNGTFKARTSYAVAVPASSPYSVAFGDFNGDGASDFASTGIAANAVSIRMGGFTAGSTSTSGVTISVLTQSSARSALDTLETSLGSIGTELGKIGALQSRLRTAANNLAVLKENYQAANSRIIDVDVASEAAAMVRSRILQEAGASVLAQANQQPALALLLLRQ